MAIIRVGIVGLSATATGTGWAASAHLPYLLKSPHYTITALCNSSVEAAQRAVEAYNLPKTTKTYGSPDDLADDPDVDIVVANTRVDTHSKVLLPSLKKGKQVYSEWPLEKNAQIAKEMLAASKHGRAKTIIGLQARQSPVIRKIKDLIDGKRIGKVLSSTVVAAAGNGGGEEGTSVAYFTDRAVGGNMFTIHFGHFIDPFLYVLGGELKQYSSILGNQRPETRIIDRKTNTVVETVTKTSPDQVLLQGTLDTGAIVSIHVRGGKAFPSQPQFLWRIYGEKGEIEVTASGVNLNVGYDDTMILLHDQSTGKLETVEVMEDEWDELPLPARNIARLYEAIRNGETNGVPDFAVAVKRHELIDDMYCHWDAKDQGRLV